jgi:putative transposase
VFVVGTGAVPVAEPACRHAFERVHQRGEGKLRRVLDQPAQEFVFPVASGKDSPGVGVHLPGHLRQVAEVLPGRHAMMVLGRQDHVGVQGGSDVPASPVVATSCHRPMACSDAVLVRYRYRLRPTPVQQQAFARVFGCARVVFNDSLRLREECRAAGEKVRDSEIQRQVITLAKQTPGRAWLADAPSVALVQACNDARRAYQNWFDSVSGKRKGRRAGHPRFRSKRSRQSIRLTRNGFRLRGQRLYVAKVGDIKVRWSRPLPSEPSSVTVIREPDGRYYVSFVVEREAAPLAVCQREIGIDVGLGRLAVTSGGEIITNPRFLRARQQHLARAQRALSRKQKHSANRAKARHRVAVLHRKVREARLDYAHKVALRLVRDNQAVYTEDLSVSGLARSRLAKSVHDAGWSQLLRLIEEKAAHYGREFHRIGRFVPTSQVCSVCGSRDGPKPLSVRTWQCGACGAIHDRDVNAARNILTAGRAERLNACGEDVRPGLALAVSSEAGTHRSAT